MPKAPHDRDPAPGRGGAVPQLLLWGLRLLAHGACRSAFERPRALDGAWLRVLGLSRRHDAGLADVEAKKALRKRLRQAETDAIVYGVSRRGVVLENVAMLAAEVHLSPVEQDLLAFAAMAHGEELLQQAFHHVGSEPNARTHELCAAVLGVDAASVKRALGRAGILWGTGLVRVGKCHDYGHPEPLQIAHGIPELLGRQHETAAAMVAHFFRRSRPARLGREDYAHLAADVDVLVRLLEGALRARTPGVNVLFYGPPGTGKTELARALGGAVGAELFEVNVEDEDGDPVSRYGRLSAYALAQRLLARAPSRLVLFDELEDVFPRRWSALGGEQRESGQDKGYTARLLEENPVPTLWLGNEVEHIDPAFLRRFDYALELRAPPVAVRRRILERYAADLPVHEDWIRRAAQDERLTPAHIERAVRVARITAPTSREDAEATLGRVLERSLALRGRARPASARLDAGAFDLGLLNAGVDLEQVLAGLERSRAGTVCLFGPPGTGKTAFAHHAAARLELPLHVRRASDLMSPFVGETEQNLAAMFRKASEEKAMILLDEADSFFRSRERAAHGWEVTQVNELLVQMEAFEGVFVCATNLMDSFDEASLRRFALKIRFDYPRPDQRRRLFDATLRALGGEAGAPDDAAARGELDRVGPLTPGDFAAVARRARLMGQPLGPGELVAALAAEVRLRRGARPALGFARPA